MRFLANENFPYDAVTALREKGHDVVWIRESAPGITDLKVLEKANADQRIILTFDKDFGELAFKKFSFSYGIILFRIPILSASYITDIVVAAIESRSDWEGYFSVIESRRIRMRTLRSK